MRAHARALTNCPWLHGQEDPHTQQDAHCLPQQPKSASFCSPLTLQCPLLGHNACPGVRAAFAGQPCWRMLARAPAACRGTARSLRRSSGPTGIALGLAGDAVAQLLQVRVRHGVLRTHFVGGPCWQGVWRHGFLCRAWARGGRPMRCVHSRSRGVPLCCLCMASTPTRSASVSWYRVLPPKVLPPQPTSSPGAGLVSRAAGDGGGPEGTGGCGAGAGPLPAQRTTAWG